MSGWAAGRIRVALLAALLSAHPLISLSAQTVLLRLAPPQGQVTRYQADLDAWLITPLLPASDTAQPTVHVTSFLTRIVTSRDSQRLEFTEHTDSSRLDFPAMRSFMAQGGQGDVLRGMRTVTRMDSRGRQVATMVVEAPNLPAGMPTLIRGVHGLVIAVARLATVGLPEHPVSPGDTWTDSLSFDMGNTPGMDMMSVQGAGSGLATIRFERIEQRHGARIAVLTAVANATAGAGDVNASATLSVSATSTLDLDLDSGRFVRGETRLSGPMVTRLGVIPVRLIMVIRAL